MSDKREDFLLRFGTANMYYAIMDKNTDGVPTYSKPIKLQGANAIALEPQGEVSPIYGDGTVFYNIVANNGYSGTIDIYGESFEMVQTVTGKRINQENGVAYESNDTDMHRIKPVAILFDYKNNLGSEKFVFYNVSFSRSKIEGKTMGDGGKIEPSVFQYNITCQGVSGIAPDNSIISMAYVNQDSALYDSFFEQVYFPNSEVPKVSKKEVMELPAETNKKMLIEDKNDTYN